MRPQALMDFIFPDEKGQHKQSLIDEDSMAQICTIARNANRKKGGSQGSVTLAAGSAAQLAATPMIPGSQIGVDIQQPFGSFLSSTSACSQSAISSIYTSSNRSLGSTGSQGSMGQDL